MAALKWLGRSVVMLALLVGAAGAFGYWRCTVLEEEILFEGAEWDGRVTRFIDEERALSQDPWFRGGPARLAVPETLRAAALRHPKDEAGLLRRLDAAAARGGMRGAVTAELSWMADLGKYDYWPSGGESPRWLSWGKLRFDKGVSSGKVKEAFREVRELARLAGTTQRWEDATAMVQLLRLEREAYDFLSSRGKPPPGVKPYEKAALEQATRVIGSAGDFFDFRWPHLTVVSVYGDLTYRIGLCSGLDGRAGFQRELASFLGRYYPERFRILGQVFDKTEGHCRSQAAKRAWSDRALASEGRVFVPKAAAEAAARWRPYRRVPILGWYLGLRLAELGLPRPQILTHYP
jgi:hypothetical protein